MMDEILLAFIVRSLAGRDKGKLFVVIGLQQGCAYLADGRVRQVEKPKLKKLKHLQRIAYYDCMTAERIKNGEKVHNSELRRMLNEFTATPAG